MKRYIIIIIVFCAIPSAVFADTVKVVVDTQGATLNAIEGVLSIPEDFTIERIYTGKSVLSLWLEKPELKDQHISFSGIAPGGFSGKRTIFTFVGNYSQSDLDRIYTKSIIGLSNDGKGTKVPVSLEIAFDIPTFDDEDPEIFSPVITKDDTVFDGKYFISFFTQDKGSGIMRYEIREGRWGSFKEANSPHVLKNQKLTSDIYVKALDYSGNERIVKVSAQRRSLLEYAWYVAVSMVCLIGLGILIKKW